jgi:hypothetical protein
MKEEKIKAALDKKAQDEMKDCTFEPSILGRGGNDATRDLDTFLGDQQKFLEAKAEKVNKRKQDLSSREVQDL